jgi:phosphoglycerate dehydrogenase-like enzyme
MTKSSPRESSSRVYRLHLESRRQQGSAFHFDANAWAAAAARHPSLASCIDASFGWDGEQLDCVLEDADFLLATRFSKPSVNAAPHLRWIHTGSAGVDQLMPLQELRDDIVLTNSSGIHSDKANEYVQMALLMLNSLFPAMAQNQRAHRWQPELTTVIRGKTAVVIGFGDIGIAAGHAAQALGVEVIAVTHSGRMAPGAPAGKVVPASRLDDVIGLADFVIVTAPLTPDTRNLLSAERQERMRTGAGIINISRAGLVDYQALLSRLHSGECGGAVLDVFDQEPLAPDAPYWDAPRLIVTPHISCDASDYNQRVLDVWFGNFQRFLNGHPLKNLVDRIRGY